MGLDSSLLQRFAAILNCNVMVTPFVYLGLPVGGCHKRDACWNGVVEKVQSKLARWKGRCLSIARRICLIKSVFSSIPLFFMSLFKLPSLVVDKLFGGGALMEGRLLGLLGIRCASLGILEVLKSLILGFLTWHC